jgi:gamma-glutamylcyclotransferase (GGCT)/AIG2-like uncharacterized protein YtfP
MMEYLFSYGTLCEAKVQQAVFGHPVPGTPDAVVGFRLVEVAITDPRAIAISGRAIHTIIDPSPDDVDQVEGQVLSLSEADLAAADAYEDAAYQRVQARLRSGGAAWVYVRAESCKQ